MVAFDSLKKEKTVMREHSHMRGAYRHFPNDDGMAKCHHQSTHMSLELYAKLNIPPYNDSVRLLCFLMH